LAAKPPSVTMAGIDGVSSTPLRLSVNRRPWLSGSEQLTSEYPDRCGVLPRVGEPQKRAELSAHLEVLRRRPAVTDGADHSRWHRLAIRNLDFHR
jgi:hypothetical protein